MDAKTALIKYIFLDVVSYSYERSVEAQTEIIDTLNTIVKETLEPFKFDSENLIFLPTGDGICICIINIIDPYDIHLQIAITILEKLNNYNNMQTDQKRQFNLRIGINENHDNLIIDINGKTNVAGTGINNAQRIMDMATDNQIFIGQSVFEKLAQREKYNNKFYKVIKTIKHNILLPAYQYIDENLNFINGIIKPEDDIHKPKEEAIPKKIAVYRFFTKYFENDILRLSGNGSNDYTLLVLLDYLTDDYMRFATMEKLERTKWESKIFNKEINSFEKAYQMIEKSFFWLICDSRKYYIEELGLEKWSKLFKNDYLSSNKNSDKQVKKQWSGLSKEMDINLPLMYPWLCKE